MYIQLIIFSRHVNVFKFIEKGIDKPIKFNLFKSHICPETDENRINLFFT